MRLSNLLLVGLFAGVAMGQVGGPYAPPAPRSPGALAADAKEMQRLSDELKELESRGALREEKRLNEEIGTIYKKLSKLRESAEYKEIDQKRKELGEKRNVAWEVERQRIAESAKVLYRQRHEELKPLAAGPLLEAGKLGLDAMSYPRIDGSTSTHPLSIVMASRLLGTRYEWAYPEPQGAPWGRGAIISDEGYLPGTDPALLAARNREAEFSLASARMVARPAGPEQERLARIINSYLATSASTHGGYVRLINGECDLNLTVRGLSEDELKAAKEKGVEIELVPVARDALVFMVSKKIKVPALTREDIRKIFSNEAMPVIGVDGAPLLRPLWRERNSGSRELFDAAIGATPPDEKNITAISGGGLYSLGMAGPYNRLHHELNGIGYSLWYYDRYMAMSPATRTIAVEGIEPTRENIVSGKYPLVTKIYAAHRKGEKPDSPAMKLIGWMLSDEGQKMVQESGYVPLN